MCHKNCIIIVKSYNTKSMTKQFFVSAYEGNYFIFGKKLSYYLLVVEKNIEVFRYSTNRKVPFNKQCQALHQFLEKSRVREKEVISINSFQIQYHKTATFEKKMMQNLIHLGEQQLDEFDQPFFQQCLEKYIKNIDNLKKSKDVEEACVEYNKEIETPSNETLLEQIKENLYNLNYINFNQEGVLRNLLHELSFTHTEQLISEERRQSIYQNALTIIQGISDKNQKVPKKGGKWKLRFLPNRATFLHCVDTLLKKFNGTVDHTQTYRLILVLFLTFHFGIKPRHMKKITKKELLGILTDTFTQNGVKAKVYSEAKEDFLKIQKRFGDTFFEDDSSVLAGVEHETVFRDLNLKLKTIGKDFFPKLSLPDFRFSWKRKVLLREPPLVFRKLAKVDKSRVYQITKETYYSVQNVFRQIETFPFLESTNPF